ncbi:HBR047Wp [Eremothecium sinecaudum]|uniref:Long chronological lifespan protein 2 n=1 Tax=Eremothecium sinecaudum TaxID=45286 RepID=A0A109UWP2_9SACH|nr:HBR047Wp [Eremothecium sinecaudum]AMD18948.1 HBR047Wp [Eremothecium sinecaudum]
MLFLLPLLYLLAPVYAFFFDFGGHGQHGQQQQQSKISYEDLMLNQQCNGYLCPETRECVKSSIECPCPFPKSQLKCILPDGKYVCISKPATHDEKLSKIYDDPIKGPKAKNKGVRDCGWVQASYKGLV